jgi:hypothetical protein
MRWTWCGRALASNSEGHLMLKSFMCVAAFAGIVGLAACEKAGEDIDSAIEKTVDGEKKLDDGPFEKAGEAVDNTVGIERKNDADSIADAVDGDKSTKPD